MVYNSLKVLCNMTTIVKVEKKTRRELIISSATRAKSGRVASMYISLKYISKSKLYYLKFNPSLSFPPTTLNNRAPVFSPSLLLTADANLFST